MKESGHCPLQKAINGNLLLNWRRSKTIYYRHHSFTWIWIMKGSQEKTTLSNKPQPNNSRIIPVASMLFRRALISTVCLSRLTIIWGRLFMAAWCKRDNPCSSCLLRRDSCWPSILRHSWTNMITRPRMAQAFGEFICACNTNTGFRNVSEYNFFSR